VAEEISDKKWYVLRVQSGKEEHVKEALEKKCKQLNLDDRISRILIPVEHVSEIKSGERRVRQRKIYPGYIMIEMDITDETWFLVRETTGVGDFVGAANKPVPMQASEVERILNQMERMDEQPKLKISYKVGDSVKVKEGPFENFDGVVDEVVPSKGLVKVIVTIFGRPTPVELEYWQVEPI